MNAAENRNVLFVDGACVLCHQSAEFFMKIDKRRVITFAALQGETAKRVLAGTSQRAERDQLLSVIYVRHCETPEQQVSDRSTAALLALRDIGGFWRVVSWLRVIPRPLRDFVYDLIAKYRYRWFGKHAEACPLPSADDAVRLLP